MRAFQCGVAGLFKVSVKTAFTLLSMANALECHGGDQMISYSALAPWYDALTEDVPYEEFAAFYNGEFKNRGRKIKTVLDLGCGTGTMTCLLAEMGYDMIAVDASEDMLSVAQSKTSELPELPLLLCQDIAELDLYGTTDAAVSCLDTLNYVPPTKLAQVFQRLSLFIEPGGLLLFDIHTPERLKAMDGQVNVDEADGVYCVWQAVFDDACLCYAMDIFVETSDGIWHREFEEHVEYAHASDEIETLLAAAGFIDICRIDGPLSEQGRLHFRAVNGRIL